MVLLDCPEEKFKGAERPGSLLLPHDKVIFRSMLNPISPSLPLLMNPRRRPSGDQENDPI